MTPGAPLPGPSIGRNHVVLSLQPWHVAAALSVWQRARVRLARRGNGVQRGRHPAPAAVPSGRIGLGAAGQGRRRIGMARPACGPVVAALALFGGAPAAASPAQRAAAVVRTVQTESAADGGAVVVVEAEGALPVPAVGALNDPPRLYFDFKGVTLGRGAVAAGRSTVLHGVRLSQYSRRPSVVRIVLDLEAHTPYRIDTSGQAGGRVTVVLSGHAPAAPSALASQPVRLAEAPTAKPSGPSRPRDADRYVAQISVVLARLHRARATIATIASAGGLTSSELHALAGELDENTQLLRAVKAPASLATPHDLLMRFCALGGRAARLRLDAGAQVDSGTVQNAASAAAGALIVLDRAGRDLAYVPPQ